MINGLRVTWADPENCSRGGPMVIRVCLGWGLGGGPPRHIFGNFVNLNVIKETEIFQGGSP